MPFLTLILESLWLPSQYWKVVSINVSFSLAWLVKNVSINSFLSFISCSTLSLSYKNNVFTSGFLPKQRLLFWGTSTWSSWSYSSSRKLNLLFFSTSSLVFNRLTYYFCCRLLISAFFYSSNIFYSSSTMSSSICSCYFLYSAPVTSPAAEFCKCSSKKSTPLFPNLLCNFYIFFPYD